MKLVSHWKIALCLTALVIVSGLVGALVGQPGLVAIGIGAIADQHLAVDVGVDRKTVGRNPVMRKAGGLVDSHRLLRLRRRLRRIHRDDLVGPSKQDLVYRHEGELFAQPRRPGIEVVGLV